MNTNHANHEILRKISCLTARSRTGTGEGGGRPKVYKNYFDIAVKFQIPISLQPDGVNHRLFGLTEFIV